MLVPLNWLAEYTEIEPGATPEQIAAELAGIGLEEEDLFGPQVTGPLVVGRVLSAVPEPQSNGKTINWCSVDVGEAEPRGIVCGAHNFGAGDLVVVSLPGAVLPGDFAIAARKTYGHVSDGMICSLKELALGEDHDGIIVLPELGLTGEPGDDAIALLGLDQSTLDVNVTPDRGYQLSLRGIAREYAQLKGRDFADPARAFEPPAPSGDGFPVELADAAPLNGRPGCDRFVARGVSGIDPDAASPYWMKHRLLQAGMRPISLTVDVTNYVMLALGQPLHAYDRDLLGEKIVVRRAEAGEKLTTLDGASRTLDAEDLLITDAGPSGASRVLGLAGVMGGADTEVGPGTVNVLVEAAHFEPVGIARTARRHKLSSEASRRYERGVDHELAPLAAEMAVRLLVEFGRGTADGPATDVDERVPAPPVRIDPGLPARIVGIPYPPEEVVRLIEATGAAVRTEDGAIVATAPSWRQDLVLDVDYVEEVARLAGYSAIPSVVPRAPAGAGLTPAQKLRRRVSNLLAARGLTEVLTYPFTREQRFEELGLPADDPRRFAVRLANPLSEESPLMRTSLLSTLVDAAVRNLGRGAKDVAIFEAGLVTAPREPKVPVAARYAPGVLPSAEQREAVFAAVPPQPYRLAAVLSGNRDRAGWWGAGRAASAADAIQLARDVAAARGVEVVASAADYAPWHPGRCARLELPGGALFGYAGELHPKVIEALGVPARTAAFELDLDSLGAAPVAEGSSEVLSTFPVSWQDVALVVDASVPAGEVTAALREGAGELLETVSLFDVYTGDQLAGGKKSLAYRLAFRAPDRTLTADETSGMRQAAAAVAADRFAATVRGEEA